MNYQNHKYNNHVIEVFNDKHREKVIEFWENQGIDTYHLKGFSGMWPYYGLVNGHFDCFAFSKERLKNENITIMTLPEEDNIYPKQMKVWDKHDDVKIIVWVYGKINNFYLTSKFKENDLTVNDNMWLYQNAEDITSDKDAITLAEIRKDLSKVSEKINKFCDEKKK